MGKETLVEVGVTGLRPQEPMVNGLTPSPDGVDGKVVHTLFFDEIDFVREDIDVGSRPCEVEDPVEGWSSED